MKNRLISTLVCVLVSLCFSQQAVAKAMGETLYLKCTIRTIDMMEPQKDPEPYDANIIKISNGLLEYWNEKLGTWSHNYCEKMDDEDYLLH